MWLRNTTQTKLFDRRDCCRSHEYERWRERRVSCGVLAVRTKTATGPEGLEPEDERSLCLMAMDDLHELFELLRHAESARRSTLGGAIGEAINGLCEQIVKWNVQLFQLGGSPRYMASGRLEWPVGCIWSAEHFTLGMQHSALDLIYALCLEFATPPMAFSDESLRVEDKPDCSVWPLGSVLEFNQKKLKERYLSRLETLDELVFYAITSFAPASSNEQLPATSVRILVTGLNHLVRMVYKHCRWQAASATPAIRFQVTCDWLLRPFESILVLTAEKLGRELLNNGQTFCYMYNILFVIATQRPALLVSCDEDRLDIALERLEKMLQSVSRCLRALLLVMDERQRSWTAPFLERPNASAPTSLCTLPAGRRAHKERSNDPHGWIYNVGTMPNVGLIPNLIAASEHWTHTYKTLQEERRRLQLLESADAANGRRTRGCRERFFSRWWRAARRPRDLEKENAVRHSVQQTLEEQLIELEELVFETAREPNHWWRLKQNELQNLIRVLNAPNEPRKVHISWANSASATGNSAASDGSYCSPQPQATHSTFSSTAIIRAHAAPVLQKFIGWLFAQGASDKSIRSLRALCRISIVEVQPSKPHRLILVHTSTDSQIRSRFVS